MPGVAPLESRSLDFQQSWNSFSCYLSQLNDLSLCVGRPGSSLKCGACPCPHRSPLVLLASEMSRIKGPQRGVGGRRERAWWQGSFSERPLGAAVAPSWPPLGSRCRGGASSAGGGQRAGSQPEERGGAREGGSLPCATLCLAPQWTPTRLSVAQDARPLIHLGTPSSKLHFPEATSSC